MSQQTALITGCSSGIGRATAEALLEADWQVYATAREQADIEALGDRPGCTTAELDVTRAADIDSVVETVLEEAGTLEMLVNNAGFGAYGPLEELSTDRLRHQFEVNVYGPHRLARAVLPAMRSAGEGRIVTVSSVAGQIAAPGMGAYAGSKHAIEAMHDALRVETAPHGIDIVLVQPGPVATPFEARADAERESAALTGAYEAVHEFQADSALLAGEGLLGVGPEAVATAIVEAACSPAPKARYRVGPVASYGLLGRLLPARWRDRVFGLLAGL